MDAKLFDTIKRNSGWPFKNMKVNEVIRVTETNGKSNRQIQSQCHAYGKNTGKKFETMVVDGVVCVKRVS